MYQLKIFCHYFFRLPGGGMAASKSMGWTLHKIQPGKGGGAPLETQTCPKLLGAYILINSDLALSST